VQTFTITPDLEAHLIKRRGRIHPFERLDAAKTAFIVVDLQNYFMADGEPGCTPPARDIVPNVNRLAAEMRNRGGLVVWIQTEAKPDTPVDWANLYESYTPEAKAKRQANLGKTGSGFPLWPALAVERGDETVIKTRYSAFIQGSSNLKEVLDKRGIDTILIGGTVTNVCCESTARDGMMLGYRTVMVADCNAATSQENHQSSLAGFLAIFGDVQTTDQTISNLAKHSAKKQAAE
jgi:ureidoacrylate peracid hydrolase